MRAAFGREVFCGFYHNPKRKRGTAKDSLADASGDDIHRLITISVQNTQLARLLPGTIATFYIRVIRVIRGERCYRSDKGETSVDFKLDNFRCAAFPLTGICIIAARPGVVPTVGEAILFNVGNPRFPSGLALDSPKIGVIRLKNRESRSPAIFPSRFFRDLSDCEDFTGPIFAGSSREENTKCGNRPGKNRRGTVLLKSHSCRLE